MRDHEIPYLRSPVFRHGSLAAFSNWSRRELTAAQLEVMSRLIKADASLQDLADVAARHDAQSAPEGYLERLRAEYATPGNLVGLARLGLKPVYDIIAIDQGYGGVYVHTVELVEKLRRRWNVLLISPEDPLFEDGRHPDDLTVPRLKEMDPNLSYFGYVQIIRALITKVQCKLLFISHRSQSLFLYDLIQRQPTIIYCDGFFDGAFRISEQFDGGEWVKESDGTLEELHFLLGQTPPGYYAITAGPNVNLALLKAGYTALASATENWCWGLGQAKNFQTALPGLRGRIRFEPPFTDPDLYEPLRVHREKVVLFTTTMHNIEKKGLPELVKAMERMPEVRVRCVVRQPDKLPPIPPAVRIRMTMGAVKKPEMVDLYHRVWLNCRTSREESSPMSILESMVCEVPQIVSPVVAEQIPLIEDGKTGFVVSPDDTEKLVRSIRTLLQDDVLRDRMGQECRRRALEYSFEKRVGLFERFLS